MLNDQISGAIDPSSFETHNGQPMKAEVACTDKRANLIYLAELEVSESDDVRKMVARAKAGAHQKALALLDPDTFQRIGYYVVTFKPEHKPAPNLSAHQLRQEADMSDEVRWFG